VGILSSKQLVGIIVSGTAHEDASRRNQILNNRNSSRSFPHCFILLFYITCILTDLQIMDGVQQDDGKQPCGRALT